MDFSNMEEKDAAILKKQITYWKEEYFNSVYETEIEDTTFIWRGLSTAEFNRAQEFFEDEFDKAEYVCSICVLYPQVSDWSDDIFAGIPEALTEEILAESGFTLSIDDMDRLILQKRDEMNTLSKQIPCIIKEAFPDISLEEIENWQFEKVMWYYARALWVLETLRGITLKREE